ncbi:TPA: lantibiotic biosynthesis protein, partial [Streptococcus equi subsp. zooepidemicus]|nr:lantibiotic biosynthesis protein [Streptococcus equi subsp. zooepidemicus]
VTIPRIELDNVVLSRQKIIVSVSYINDFLDLRFPDKIEYILNFLEGSGFNTKVMVYFGKIVEEDKNYFVNLEKPQYFDFTSILFNKLFFKELNKFDYMVIEELIPNLDKDVMMTEYIKEYTE